MVTVNDLPNDNAPRGIFLFCARCGEHYSACKGDYFWMPPDEPFSCKNGHRSTRLVLAKERRIIERIKA